MRLRLMVEVGKGKLLTLILGALVAGSAFADRAANREWVERNFTTHGAATNAAKAVVAAATGGLVPYTGATADVDLGYYNLNACNVWARMGFCCGDPQTMVTSGTYCGDSFADGSWNYYYLPWSPGYGEDPTHDFAMRSDVLAATVTAERIVELVQSMDAAQKAALRTALGIE